ncbi:unnamed protein product, partial [marine sediment metagenome]
MNFPAIKKDQATGLAVAGVANIIETFLAERSALTRCAYAADLAAFAAYVAAPSPGAALEGL